jgi:predicted dienelactone hydrolase
MRRTAVSAVLVLAALVSSGCSSPTSSPPSHQIGAYQVAQIDQTYVDSSRRTPPNGAYPGSSARTLKVDLYIPERSEGSHLRFPLVVFSPGFTAIPADYDAVESAWASAGYVVAGVQFPLSTRLSPGGATLNDIANQPGDVKFVISQLLKLNKQSGDPVSSLLTTSGVAVAGHSLGAVTTLGLVANTCCRDADPRIKAAVVMSGYPFTIPGGKYFPKGGYYPPMLSISGSKDPLATVPDTNQLFAQYPSTKYQAIMVGGPHVDFVPPWETTLNKTIVAFLNAYLAKSGPTSAVMKDSNVPGLATIRSA